MIAHPHILKQLSLVPYFGCIFGFASLTGIYFIALINHDIEPFMSYVSDAAGDPPQSGLFGMCMVVLVLLATPVLFMMYMRNKFELEIAQNVSRKSTLEMLNVCIAVFSSASCLGMTIVVVNPLSHLRRDGQWVDPILIPHLIGAVLFFSTALLHVLAQSYLQYKLSSSLKDMKTKVLISAIAVISTVLLMSYAPIQPDPWRTMDPYYRFNRHRISLHNALVNLHRMGFLDADDELHDRVNETWITRSARSYPKHAFWSIASEWIFLFNYLAFYATFATDLNGFNFALDLYMPAMPAEAAAPPRDDSRANLIAEEVPEEPAPLQPGASSGERGPQSGLRSPRGHSALSQSPTSGSHSRQVKRHNSQPKHAAKSKSSSGSRSAQLEIVDTGNADGKGRKDTRGKPVNAQLHEEVAEVDAATGRAGDPSPTHNRTE
ncbi:DNA damage-regulated autophagy modulator protein 1-like [Ornithodoros turicata]|uniref:DNA damage-regulated autophagy modulator protein 1-like n=1 Tax=Ornithodoros turicata TaxID=34597 RepID=UPI0031396327